DGEIQIVSPQDLVDRGGLYCPQLGKPGIYIDKDSRSHRGQPRIQVSRELTAKRDNPCRIASKGFDVSDRRAEDRFSGWPHRHGEAAVPPAIHDLAEECSCFRAITNAVIVQHLVSEKTESMQPLQRIHDVTATADSARPDYVCALQDQFAHGSSSLFSSSACRVGIGWRLTENCITCARRHRPATLN